MKLPLSLFINLLLFFFLAVTWLPAAGSRAWVTSSRQDFESGTLDGVVVSSRGDIRLGLERRHILCPARMIWDALLAPDGVLYLAGGDPTVLYKLQGDELKEVDTCHGDAALTSLVWFDGALHAAAIPDGKIYRLEETNFRLAAKLPVPYIWSLATDGEALYAGTGPGGQVWRMKKGEKAKQYFNSGEFNCLALSFDKKGRLIVGTSQEGLLLRVLQDGQREVIHDFEEDEIKAIVPHEGGFIVAVNRLKSKRSRVDMRGVQRTTDFDILSRSLNKRFGSKKPQNSQKSAKEDLLPGGRRNNLKGGAVYHLLPDGRVDELFSHSTEYVLDIAMDDNEHLWVATGPQGRVFSVIPGEIEFTQADTEQEQAMALLKNKEGAWLVPTANFGGLMTIGPNKATTGVFYSRVFDAGFKSKWGRCHFQCAGKLSLFTRSGNTEEPDDSWSKWRKLLNESGSHIDSPAARYLQYRVSWTKEDPAAILSKLAIYFRTTNQKPKLVLNNLKEPRFGRKTSKAKGGRQKSSKQASKKKAKSKSSSNKGAADLSADLGVDLDFDLPPLPPLPDFLDSPSTSTSLGTKSGEKSSSAPRGEIHLSWTGKDPDGDALHYRVFCQGMDEKLWLELTDEDKPLSTSSFQWKTEMVADGRYRLKVLASDEQSNSAAYALQTSKVSEPFIVDNTRPKVTVTKLDSKKLEVKGHVVDELSIITVLSYSVDGRRFKPLVPSDGIFDFKEESFVVKLHDLKPGPHVIAIKAVDVAGNTGMARKGFVIE